MVRRVVSPRHCDELPALLVQVDVADDPLLGDRLFFLFDLDVALDHGDKEATERAFQDADVTVKQAMIYPRVHPAPMETCGAVADYDVGTGKMTLWVTSQAPHAHRTLAAIVTGLPEHQIRVISPDIGGGFGGKVPVYPGYVIAVVAALTTGKPVKWIEDRSENLQADSFARDYHMKARLAAASDGTRPIPSPARTRSSTVA